MLCRGIYLKSVYKIERFLYNGEWGVLVNQSYTLNTFQIGEQSYNIHLAEYTFIYLLNSVYYKYYTTNKLKEQQSRCLKMCHLIFYFLYQFFECRVFFSFLYIKHNFNQCQQFFIACTLVQHSMYIRRILCSVQDFEYRVHCSVGHIQDQV